jgi:DNA repair photolyase
MTTGSNPHALRPPKGRGAPTNHAGRYERQIREAIDDGWTAEDPPAKIETTVTREIARTIITRNTSPDLSFDRTINPYRGCEHGCIYCYARPNHSYVGHSAGLDFESQLYAKVNAAELLEEELYHPDYRPRTIVLGGVTDVYQPLERRLTLTRDLLQVLARFRHPFALVTKSTLVMRDLDIIAPMAEMGLAKVAVSVTTLDRKLARSMEPRAATPERRLSTIAALSEAGVPTTVMVAPIIPSLNDHEIENVLERSAASGARDAGYVLLRLPRELAGLFEEWLIAEHPDRAKRVMATVRQTRAGADYDSAWATRMKGNGPYAELIADRFRKAVGRLGLDKPRFELDTTQFRRPPRSGDQMSMF